jgi:hypothetical protein
MSVLAHIDARPEQRGRTAVRRKLRVVAQGSRSLQPSTPVVIHDLSETGVLIETEAELLVGEQLDVRLPESGARAAKVVWNSGRYFGCQFRHPVSRAAVSAALLRSPPAERPMASDALQLEPAQGLAAQNSYAKQAWPFRDKLRLIVALTLGFWILNRVVLWLFA